MGALHEGHMTLMNYSKRENGLTVASIFVNPTQFSQGEDLDKYPRQVEADMNLLKKNGVDVLFLPSSEEMYSPNKLHHVEPAAFSKIFEGQARPEFFRGVSTIVTKLFNISYGAPDPNGPATINDAWNAGMAHVDGYIFPCYSCGNPAGQMDATIDYLSSHNVRMLKEGELRESSNSTVGASVGMLWLDVEGTQYWSSSTSANVNFLSAMVQRGKERGVSLGIYSSASQWNPIMGGSSAFSYLPLWYAHYDMNPSFSDWYSFGGWSKPAIKQYAGDQYFCSAGVDKNYY
eukprot:gene3649-2630_t